MYLCSGDVKGSELRQVDTSIKDYEMKQVKLMSRTTPSHQMQLRTWLAETLCIRRFGFKLPSEFWRLPKYKFLFAAEIKAVSKFIKKYGDGPVVRAVLDNKTITTLGDYAAAEVFIQNEVESLKRLETPKDTTKVEEVKNNISEVDLRGVRVKTNKSLFSKLDGIINGER